MTGAPIGPAAPHLECGEVGSGGPITVVAHGFGADLAGARLLAAGLDGTRLIYCARGHGGSPVGPEPITYAVLADDLDRVGRRASRAVGVSLGASTVLHLLARHPGRFERVVVQLPPGASNGHSEALVSALEAGDREGVERLVRREVPPALDLDAYVRSRTQALLDARGLPTFLRSLRAGPALPTAAALSAVTAPVLVVAQQHDLVHPVSAAEELVARLPRGELAVFERPLLLERRRVRALLRDFLADAPSQ
ncbi:MAG: hypothetical protein JWL64_2645 [Frankiales bacterium]|nr:hypothetical protein [Frankiales bacterium]